MGRPTQGCRAHPWKPIHGNDIAAISGITTGIRFIVRLLDHLLIYISILQSTSNKNCNVGKAAAFCFYFGFIPLEISISSNLPSKKFAPAPANYARCSTEQIWGRSREVCLHWNNFIYTNTILREQKGLIGTLTVHLVAADIVHSLKRLPW